MILPFHEPRSHIAESLLRSSPIKVNLRYQFTFTPRDTLHQFENSLLWFGSTPGYLISCHLRKLFSSRSDGSWLGCSAQHLSGSWRCYIFYKHKDGTHNAWCIVTSMHTWNLRGMEAIYCLKSARQYSVWPPFGVNIGPLRCVSPRQGPIWSDSMHDTFTIPCATIIWW